MGVNRNILLMAKPHAVPAGGSPTGAEGGAGARVVPARPQAQGKGRQDKSPVPRALLQGWGMLCALQSPLQPLMAKDVNAVLGRA